MKVSKSIRWAFNISDWRPTCDQLKLCFQCIQKEEKERIDRFVYVEDFKSSMVGQLLMRKAASEILSIPYDKSTFSRTESGKPFLVNEKASFSFNVSHHGDFCVLASEQNLIVGIDVMKIEHRGKKPVSEFFNLMKKQFSYSEWEFITLPGTEKEQLQRFYRLWCLKESYVKATGTGISYDLQSLSFSCPTSRLFTDKIITDTKLYVKGTYAHNWQFEESALDDEHYVAVAICLDAQENDGPFNAELQRLPTSFTVLSFEELMEKSIAFETVDENYWDMYRNKSYKLKQT